MWEEVTETWTILFGFDASSSRDREAFLAAYNAIDSPTWYCCIPENRSLSQTRADRTILQLLVEIKFSDCGDSRGTSEKCFMYVWMPHSLKRY